MTFKRILVLFLFFSCVYAQEQPPSQDTVQEEEVLPQKTIRSISISGNTLITQEALLARIPYQAGDPFHRGLTGDLIRNLYGLQYFNNIIVDIDEASETEVDLFITVEEKKKIESILYEGNDHLKADEIEKKLKLSEIPAMNEEELELYATQIKQLYAEKNYHAVTITASLRPAINNTYTAVFCINEGIKATVQRVIFEGNTCVSSKKLRNIIFTREDWLFGFLNKAGSFQPEMLEMDKHILENYYQSHGYLAARVTQVDVDTNQETQCITVTFTIEEGDLYTISSVSAPGNDLLTEEQLLNYVPIVKNQLYSKELIRQTMENLRNIWGRFGYIYADIEPVIIPNLEDKTVELTFKSDLGNPVTLNKINICGNFKTRDYVIRRAITLCEGQLLTTPSMDISKERVESLGYFDQQNGVEWKINKISENCVDLDLMLKEVKTGNINSQFGYGGADPQSPSTGFRVGANLSDRNLFGTGIRANMNASWSKEDHSFMVNIYQPWLFDRPIGFGFGFYHRRSLYEDFKNVNEAPSEPPLGG